LDWEIIDRDEDAVSETEEAAEEEEEFHLVEGLDHLSARHGLRAWRMESADGEIGDDEEEEDQKGADSHGPPIADLLDKMGDHDGEDDTTDTGTGGENAECSATLEIEPSTNTTQS
jgi:hypothetical protein